MDIKLTDAEKAQFDLAVAEHKGDAQAADEWVTLMWMITMGSHGEQDAFDRRQATRRLFAEAIKEG